MFKYGYVVLVYCHVPCIAFSGKLDLGDYCIPALP